MKFHQLSCLLTGLLFVITPVKGGAETSGPLNVLFIAVDDLRPELGCYGAREVRSPQIDALAKEALVFDRAYCQYPLCSPSRISILTGRRPEAAQIFDLKTALRDKHPDWVSLPQLFKNNGYKAISIGKIFHGIEGPMGDPESWSVNPRAGNDVAPDSGGLRHRGHGLPYEALKATDEELPDGDVARMAAEALRENVDKPFFLAVGMAKPHLPFVAPERYWRPLQETSVPLATNGYLPKGAPEFASNLSGELRQYVGVPRQGDIPTTLAAEVKTGYLASVAYMDAQVGKILAELKRLHLDDKTIVVLWGDHGYCLGEHNTWTKHNLWEETAQVPLIIRDPAGRAAGKHSRALVELVDVYPTLTEMCGLKAPSELEGKSLVPLLEKPDGSVKNAAFTTWRKSVPGVGKIVGISMRTDRYRLTIWQTVDEGREVAVELYDHQTDPEENTNIAGETANKELLSRLKAELNSGAGERNP